MRYIILEVDKATKDQYRDYLTAMILKAQKEIDIPASRRYASDKTDMSIIKGIVTEILDFAKLYTWNELYKSWNKGISLIQSELNSKRVPPSERTFNKHDIISMLRRSIQADIDEDAKLIESKETIDQKKAREKWGQEPDKLMWQVLPDLISHLENGNNFMLLGAHLKPVYGSIEIYLDSMYPEAYKRTAMAARNEFKGMIKYMFHKSDGFFSGKSPGEVENEIKNQLQLSKGKRGDVMSIPSFELIKRQGLIRCMSEIQKNEKQKEKT